MTRHGRLSERASGTVQPERTSRRLPRDAGSHPDQRCAFAIVHMMATLTTTRYKVRCHLLGDGGKDCLLGFVTLMHGDKTRGHGEIERD